VKLLTIVIFARVFSADEYGRYASAFALVSMTVVLYDFGISNKMLQSLLHSWNYKKIERYALIKMQLGVLVVFTSLIATWLYTKEIEEFFLYFALIIYVAANDYLIGIFSSIYKSKNEFKKDSIFKVKTGIILLIVTLIALMIFNEIVHVAAVQAFSVGSIVFWYINNHLPTIRKKLLKIKLNDFKYLIGSSPLALYGLFSGAIVSIDLVMVGYYLDDQSAGIYSISTRILYFVQLPATAISVVLFSRYNFSNENLINFAEKEQKVFNNILALISFASIAVVLFILIFGELFIVLLFGEKYKESQSILIQLGYAISPIFLIQVFVNISIHRLMFKSLLLVSGFSAFASLLLNHVLISNLGINGAAFATIIAYYLFFFGIFFSITYKLKNILLNRSYYVLLLSGVINFMIISFYG